MDEDLVQEDVVIFKVGPVTSCSVFRDEIVKSVSDEQDPKQAVVDRVMEVLEQIHLEVEQKRQTMPGVQPQEPDFSTFLSTT